MQPTLHIQWTEVLRSHSVPLPLAGITASCRHTTWTHAPSVTCFFRQGLHFLQSASEVLRVLRVEVIVVVQHQGLILLIRAGRTKEGFSVVAAVIWNLQALTLHTVRSEANDGKHGVKECKERTLVAGRWPQTRWWSMWRHWDLHQYKVGNKLLKLPKKGLQPEDFLVLVGYPFDTKPK